MQVGSAILFTNYGMPYKEDYNKLCTSSAANALNVGILNLGTLQPADFLFQGHCNDVRVFVLQLNMDNYEVNAMTIFF